MKNSITTTGTIAAVMFSAILNATTSTDSCCMAVFGTVKQQLRCDEIGRGKLLSDVSITILDEARGTAEVYQTDKAGKCRFNLPLKRQFEIRVSKENYVSKTIMINTEVPEDMIYNYKLFFEMALFESKEGVDVSLLSKPIGKVAYDTLLNRFNYDQQYTRLVNEIISRMYCGVNDLNVKWVSTINEMMSGADSLSHQNSNIAASEGHSKPIYTTSLNNSMSTSLNNIINTSSASVIGTEGEASSSEQSKTEIIFKVQVWASKRPHGLNSTIFSRVKNVNEYSSDMLHKYIVGEFKTLDEAQAALHKIVKNGFQDAFIIAFQEGKRITVGEALTSLKK